VSIEPDPKACEQARNNLEVMRTKPRIRVYGDDGELRYLTPEEVDKEIQRSELTAEVHCRD
jgi:hypothetical protein